MLCALVDHCGLAVHMFITTVCKAGYPSNTMKPTNSIIIGTPIRSVDD